MNHFIACVLVAIGTFGVVMLYYIHNLLSDILAELRKK